MAEINYDAVLEDLEARRAAFNRNIDAAIASIRQVLTVSTDGQSLASASTPPSGQIQILDNGFLGLSLIDAAKVYLRMARRKQTNKDIADALEKGGFVHTSKAFVNTVGTALWRAEREGDKDIFRQGRYWLLSEWAPGRRRTSPGQGVSLRTADAEPAEPNDE